MAQNGQWLSEHRHKGDRKDCHLPKVDTVKVIPSSVVVPVLEGAVPLTLRQAVSSLGITEESPLQSLKNLNNLEVIEK